MPVILVSLRTDLDDLTGVSATASEGYTNLRSGSSNKFVLMVGPSSGSCLRLVHLRPDVGADPARKLSSGIREGRIPSTKARNLVMVSPMHGRDVKERGEDGLLQVRSW